jgi:type III secretory pathway component EscU
MTEEKNTHILFAYRYAWGDTEMPDLICEGTKEECKEMQKTIPSDEYHRTSIYEKTEEDYE